jgi:hypothetical protein
MHSRRYSLRRSVFRSSLSALTGLAITVAMAIAADYGIGSVQAGTLDAATTPPASSVQAVAVSPTSDSAESLASGDVPGSRPAASGEQAIGPDPGRGFVRLPGHIPAALARATLVDSGPSPSSEALTLNLVMKRDDQAGFEHYLEKVYDAQSTSYRHFLTQKQLTKRFGPSVHSYTEVVTYLRAQGLRVVKGSKNRITLTVSGSESAVERALRIHFQQYREGDKTFYATTTDPALPARIAFHVVSIDGLSALSAPNPAYYSAPYLCPPGTGKNYNPTSCKARIYAISALFGNFACISFLFAGSGLAGAGFGAAGAAGVTGAFWDSLCPFLNIATNWNNYVLTYNYALRLHAAADRSSAHSNSSVPLDGAGQKIGLLEYDTFYMSDVSNFLTLIGTPSVINSLSVVPVNGGVASPGSGESEVLLDIDTVMSLAPGAKVVVYDAPFTGQAASYSTLFNTMVNDGVTIISNSWASCEDQVSQAEAMGIDTVLQTAAASGISVFNGTGDAGSTCLDGSANTISVPADSPHATAVGGTSYPNGYGEAGTYNGETWWDGSTQTPATGQGGFGVSRLFARPTYQNGLNSNSMRSIPDVAIRADPNDGLLICQQDNGGCPAGFLVGGTSMAAPEWAAVAASINQVQGKNIGAFNAVLYPLAATDGFHNAASMNSDFYHVGLGSPNPNVINRLLKGQTVGLPVAANFSVSPVPPAAPVTINANGNFTVPADGQTSGGVRVTLVDANGNIVSGKTVTLTASGGNAVLTPSHGVSTVADGAVVFTVTDLTAETITYTATDTTDGIVIGTAPLTFGVPSAASAGITADPPTLPADGQTPATIVVTLKDALNRPTPGKAISIADAGAHAVITGPTPAVTDANGQIQFSATDQVNETVTFTAADVTDNNLPFPGSATVTYSGSTNTACGVGVAPVGGGGYTVTPFITGLQAAYEISVGGVAEYCTGANNPVFLSSGAVLATDSNNGDIYQMSLAGGSVAGSTLLATQGALLSNLIFGKDGSLYATVGGGSADLVQLNPTTGAEIRTVAAGLSCPAGLAVDPLSGDLFFDNDCSGGPQNSSIFRVIDPANSDPTRPTSVVVYATLPSAANGGMVFAPNGTLYAVSGYYGNINAPVEQISGTNSATVTVTPVPGITSDFAVAIGTTNADGSASSLIVEPAGNLSEVPIANPTAATVLATGSPGVGVTGPDGCLYSAHYDTVYRLAPSTGSCSFVPTSPAPSIGLVPGTISPNPEQGGSQTFSATLKNVSTLSGVPVFFLIGGANAQIKLTNTDANGNATLTYTAAQAGADTVVATTTVGSTALTSNKAQVTWSAGKHVTFVNLSSSPQGGTVNTPVNLVASLTDVSAGPAASLSGQSVTITLDGSNCTATTNSTGLATCSLTPTTPGTGTLTASFAGSSSFVAAKQSIGFNVSAAPTPAPTVTISASPATITAGSPATITWSSTNATACAASGSWSGSEATSGIQSVTPAANGSYSYTLTCTGTGGSASATAVLSATLVAVSVTAKSGGGALSWYVLLALGFLVMLRLRASMPGGVATRARGTCGKCVGLVLWAMLFALAAVHAVRADQSAATVGSAASPDQAAWLDPFYVGIRAGSMRLREDSGKIDQGLAALGFGDVAARADTSGTAGTMFVGYELTPYAAIELGYTYRDSNTAYLSGTIPSNEKLTPLLQDTTELIRGYGNIVSLSYSGRFEVLPRFSLEPRLGGFFWATKVSAVGFDDRIDVTHEGGGVTAGLTAAYRVWRGLELGVNVDHYRGFPNNIATLYGGSLEWRFGP